MARIFKTKSGKKFVFLNPSEKGKRFSRQLRSGKDQNGKALSDTAKAWRSGYLAARQDSAKAYNAKHKK